MPNLSPETGGNITVSDINGVKRVEIGQLTDADGEPTGDYGVLVVGPDGETEILDGVNDVLTIVASGSLSVLAVADGASGNSTVTHTELTGYTEIPVLVASILTSPGTQLTPANWLDILQFGGAITIVSASSAIIDLNAGSPRVTFVVNNESGSAISRYLRYFILRQLGL